MAGLLVMCAVAKASVAALPASSEALGSYDDFHYPSEERAERAVAEASMPRLVEVQPTLGSVM